MARKAKDPLRSAAPLRIMMRRWLQRAAWGGGLTALSGLGLVACWRYEAHPFWWLLSGLGILSALIGVFADINAYYTTKQRVARIEGEQAGL